MVVVRTIGLGGESVWLGGTDVIGIGKIQCQEVTVNWYWYW